MSKCLVTKLNGTVPNTDLLRIGEFRIHFDKSASPTTSNRGENFTFSKNVKLEILGDAYFTDENLSVNLGKTLTVLKDISTSVYVSNADCDICVLDKYSFSKLNDWVKNTTNDNGNKHFSLEGLKYSTGFLQLQNSNSQATGDIANLKNLTQLTFLGLSNTNTQVTGDIANLKNLTQLTSLGLSNTQVTGDIANLKNLTQLTSLVLNNTQATGDIANLKNLTQLTFLGLSNTNTQVTGDIANLKNLTQLTSLGLSNTQVTGDIANLKNLTQLTSLVLNNTQATGDIANLKNLTQLVNCRLHNVSGNINTFDNFSKLTVLILQKSNVTGDLATLPATLTMLFVDNNSFSWSSRPSSSKILAIEGNPKIDKIDKMLQDLAQCQVGITSSSATWEKAITANGSRTSASDSAVQALQNKGYTVSIIPLTD